MRDIVLTQLEREIVAGISQLKRLQLRFKSALSGTCSEPLRN